MSTHIAKPIEQCHRWRTDPVNNNECLFYGECTGRADVCVWSFETERQMHLCAPCYHETFEDPEPWPNPPANSAPTTPSPSSGTKNPDAD